VSSEATIHFTFKCNRFNAPGLILLLISKE
jgi:hypothetical protein